MQMQYIGFLCCIEMPNEPQSKLLLEQHKLCHKSAAPQLQQAAVLRWTLHRIENAVSAAVKSNAHAVRQLT